MIRYQKLDPTTLTQDTVKTVFLAYFVPSGYIRRLCGEYI